MQFRILSYNIHKCIGGVDRKYKPERIIETIDYYKPDIVLLQEVDDGVPRSRRDRQVDLLADALGFEHKVYQANVFLRIGCYGNAILSHFPMSNKLDVNLTVEPKKRRRGLAVQVRLHDEHHTKSIELVNVHLGLAAYERAIQLYRLIDDTHLSHVRSDKPILLGGDFNDVWENLCKKILTTKGFNSVLGKSKTYPAVYPSRALDRIFHRGKVQVLNAFVGHSALARVASDHLPIIADLSLFE